MVETVKFYIKFELILKVIFISEDNFFSVKGGGVSDVVSESWNRETCKT